MQSVEPMILYASSGGVGRKLKKANKRALAGKDPVIKMTFFLLEMTDHKIAKGGHELQVPLSDIGPCFLVKDAHLIREGLTP